MALWICRTCGAEHPDTLRPPAACAICLDDRQWVPASGQSWISATDVEVGRSFEIAELEPDLFAITVTPEIGIGQRTLLLRTPAGNVLWEPSAYISAALVVAVLELGAVVAVTASHPHLAGAAVSWSHLLSVGRDEPVPIYWNAKDERWIQRPDAAYALWRVTVELVPGARLVRAGGHFPGSAVLHWPAGAGGRGVLFTGDTIGVGPSRRTVSFMRSFPNLLPLPERLVRGVLAAVEPYAYDRIYGAFSAVDTGAKQVVTESAARYLRWLRDEIRDPDEDR